MNIRYVLAFAVASSASLAQACIFSITNDTSTDVVLTYMDNSESVILPAGQNQQFGSSSKHSKFYVGNQTTANTFVTAFQVEQFACSQTHQIHLAISEVMAGQPSDDNKDLLTITPFVAESGDATDSSKSDAANSHHFS